MNILFTCAGRRNYLLQYFKNVLSGNGNVVAADMQATAPAMADADKAIVVPGVYESKYIDSLLEICHSEKIQGILSLNDLELPILAAAREQFDAAGVKLIVSNETVIEICFDKHKTNLFAESLNIKTPHTFLSLADAKTALLKGTLAFPLVIKPRWGSASIGIEFPESMEELELAYILLTKKLTRSILSKASNAEPEQAILIQEKINGIEYGLDILNDFSGKPAQVYVKEKLAMRAGETDKAVLRNIPALEEMGFQIAHALSHIGNLDCDIFESNGEYYLLEMNPRFGGGYPFSHMSGANYPAAIIAWLEGKEYDFSSFQKIYDQAYAKCDTLIKIGNE